MDLFYSLKVIVVLAIFLIILLLIWARAKDGVDPI